MKYIKKNQVPTLTLKAFNNLYKKGYDKMYPDINLVRIEKVFKKKRSFIRLWMWTRTKWVTFFKSWLQSLFY